MGANPTVAGNHHADAASIQNRIVADLGSCKSELETYERLIEIGRRAPSMEAQYRTERYAVSDCQSRVWIRVKEDNGRLRFSGDSDTRLIKGILALLLEVADNRTPEQIVGMEFDFLDRTGLLTHLSPARGNGITAIVHTLKSEAEKRL